MPLLEEEYRKEEIGRAHTGRSEEHTEVDRKSTPS